MGANKLKSGSFENITYKLFVYACIKYMIFKQNLLLNNLQELICHKNPTNLATTRDIERIRCKCRYEERLEVVNELNLSMT